MRHDYDEAEWSHGSSAPGLVRRLLDEAQLVPRERVDSGYLASILHMRGASMNSSIGELVESIREFLVPADEELEKSLRRLRRRAEEQAGRSDTSGQQFAARLRQLIADVEALPEADAIRLLQKRGY